MGTLRGEYLLRTILLKVHQNLPEYSLQQLKNN